MAWFRQLSAPTFGAMQKKSAPSVYKDIRADPVLTDMLVPSHWLSEASGYEDCSSQMVL
jgi:hypothetical protein